MRWGLNIALMVMLLGLAGVVYFEPGLQQEEQKTRLLPDTGQITEITLERQGEESIRLVRKGSEWWLQAPIEVRANTFRMEMILALMNAESLQQYPVAGLNLAQYELDKPAIRLHAGGITLAFGGVEPLNNRRYVRLGDTMHMIRDDRVSLLKGGWKEFADTALFDSNVILKALTVPGVGSLKRGEQGWRLEGGAKPYQGSMDRLVTFVDDWRYARASEINRYKDRKAKGDVTVEYGDGRSERLLVLSRAPTLILARPESQLQYQFSEAQAQRLLNLPAEETTPEESAEELP